MDNNIETTSCLSNKPINLGCSRSLLRQTVILSRKDKYLWGIASLNMPPMKPISGTPKIVFKGKLEKVNTNNLFENNFAINMYKYVKKVKKSARKNGQNTWYEITSDTKLKDIKFDTD